MCLPMTNHRPPDFRNTVDGASPHLLEAISEGMHSMAQPLTVLRATLEVASGNATEVSHFQRAIDSSLSEVVRVAETMAFVQELVRIARYTPTPAAIEIQPVLATVHEDLARILDYIPPALASPGGLRQCLFYLLQQAQTEAVAGDIVEVCVRARDDSVGVLVRHEAASEIPSAQITRRSDGLAVTMRQMALAEAVAAAEQGRLWWQASPFKACLTLPVGRLELDQRQGRG